MTKNKNKNKVSEVLTYAVIGLLVVIVIGLSIWSELGIWDECRSDHSLVYCWRVLGHK